jgi:hypothetical protein
MGVEQVLPGEVSVGGGMRWEKVIGRRIWCKYCIHLQYVYVNGKMKPFETIPGRQGEGG